MRKDREKAKVVTLVLSTVFVLVFSTLVFAQSNWNVDKDWLDNAEFSTQSSWKPILESNNWWEEADKIVWFFSDSQPKVDTDFQRMNQCADDLNSLPFSADYCIGAGDITNCENTGDPNNIDMTFQSLNRINWFKANESEGGLIVPGNHDQMYWKHYNEVFNGDWNNWKSDKLDYLFNISFGNFIFYGLIPVNSRPPNNFVPALNQLRDELQYFDDNNIEKNVFIVYHYPAGDHYGFNWRLHNCGNNMQPHKTCMTTASNNSLFNILDVWGEKYVVACFSGHVHQDWRHSGCQCVVHHNDTYFINLGQFGDGGGGACGESVKVGFSMFMNVVNGSDNVTFYKRNSFLEHVPFNAVNEIIPYWMYDCDCTMQVVGNLTIPLEYPALVNNSNPGEPDVVNGDVNGDGVIDVDDVYYLMDYLFKEGDEPVDCTCP